MKKIIALFLVVVLFAACQDGKNESFNQITIETSKTVYSDGSSISFTIKNNDSNPLYVATCGDNQVSVAIRGTLSISSEFSNCTSDNSVTLAPGATLTSSVNTQLPSGEYVVQISIGRQPNQLSGTALSNHFSIE